MKGQISLSEAWSQRNKSSANSRPGAYISPGDHETVPGAATTIPGPIAKENVKIANIPDGVGPSWSMLSMSIQKARQTPVTSINTSIFTQSQTEVVDDKNTDLVNKLFNDISDVHHVHSKYTSCGKSSNDHLVWKKHGSKQQTPSGNPCQKLVVVAIKDHADSKKHHQCIEAELLYRCSTFQHDLDRKAEVEHSVVDTAFDSLYWLMKEELANRKFTSLKLAEKLAVHDNMKLFDHRSHPSVQEMEKL
ncbi:hypothetical protein LSH36_491g01029 [Paralvinella palmiformis]|uniref:Uncharacterized protein n=1 Tax=Paralvinella palmiformis TaxID=53620 RepID=A0AAD9J8G8_9ANNE|nr:hypothetical protein LSH36_491g01029 [Paralvinella palmiformis]